MRRIAFRFAFFEDFAWAHWDRGVLDMISGTTALTRPMSSASWSEYCGTGTSISLALLVGRPAGRGASNPYPASKLPTRWPR